MAKGKKYQAYNGRNGRWILFKASGQIEKTSKTKFSGVPVKGKKSKKGSSKSPMQKKTSAKQSKRNARQRPPLNGWPQMWLWEWL